MYAFYRFRFYELDHSICVGEEQYYAFYGLNHSLTENGPHVHSGTNLVFANGLISEIKDLFRYRCIINSIYHPELGYLTSINARGLDYILTLSNGLEILMNAEEKPGLVFGEVKQPTDWAFFVDLLPLGP